MRKLLFVLSLIFASASCKAYAYGYDYDTVVVDGLSYYISIFTFPYDPTQYEAYLTYPGYDYNVVSRGYHEGDIVIPDSITLPDRFGPGEHKVGVVAIQSSAFCDSPGLRSVTIPSTVAAFGFSEERPGLVNCYFEGCSGLKTINVADGNSHFSSVDGVLFSKDKSTLIAYPSAKETVHYVMPEEVTEVNEKAFANAVRLNRVTFSAALKSIGVGAFDGCSSLDSIVVPASVENIGDGAFINCTALASLNLSSGLRSVGDSAFAGCSKLVSVSIPSSVASVGAGAFSNCSALATVSLPGSEAWIGVEAFAGCTSLVEITLPEGTTAAARRMFAGCTSLSKAVIGGSVYPNSFSETFEGCESLSQVMLPEGLDAIGDRAFQNCKALTGINVPDAVKSIGARSFADCTALRSVILGGGLTQMGDSVFWGCPNIVSVEAHAAHAPLSGLREFSYDIYDKATLTVPQRCLNEYKYEDPWRNFANIVEGNYSNAADIVVDNMMTCDVYGIDGQLVKSGVPFDRVADGLPRGCYVVSRNGVGYETEILKISINR